MTADEMAALTGRTVTRDDAADAHRWAAYHRLLGLEPGVDAPLALHWLLFTEIPAETRADGHAATMAPFPPLPYPRRMWAGGEVNWHAPLTPGAAVTRTTTIVRAEPKSGASGDFLLTSLQHRVQGADGVSLIEERQDIVFLPAATQPGAAPARPLAFAPDWQAPSRAFGPVDLFRYSALTLNGHRIHYDADYARSGEHYPGLVVHGPLLATTLIQAAARRRGGVPLRFSYRAVAPVFAGDAIRLVGRSGGGDEELAIIGADDGVRMSGTMTFG